MNNTALRTKSDFVSNADDRLLALLKDFHIVKIPDNEYENKLTWCLSHCRYKFRDLSYQENFRAWYFESEEDAAVFALKFS